MGIGNLDVKIGIALGAVLLAVSLTYSTRIIRELAPGTTQSRWELLRGFLVLFIAGYVVYLGTFPARRDAFHVVVSSIFFLGACFVLLVCMLARTAR